VSISNRSMDRAAVLRRMVLLSCVSTVSLLGSRVNAQTSTSTVSNSNQPEDIQEIIVTAQKRSERLQDVPMSINAATGEQLRERGITTTEDLVKLVPGFTFTKALNGLPIYFLRGVGFFTEELGVSPAVTAYVDQVPLPFAPMSRGATLDLERVEVLKGPQGTLFGENSTGGAINYIAAKPSDHFEAGFETTYGRFNEADGEGFISSPIAEGLTARLAVRTESSGDWQYDYFPANGPTLGSKRFINARALIDWQASSNARFELSISGWRDTSDAQQAQLIRYTPLATPAQGGRPPSYPITTYPDSPNNDRAAGFSPAEDLQLNNKFYQFALHGDFNLSEAVQLTSITSYVHYNEFSPFDLGASSYPLDLTAYPNSYQRAMGTITSFSQELRLNGTSGRLKWLGGANFQSDTPRELWAFEGLTSRQQVGPFPYDAFQVVGNQQVKTYSGFGSLDYALTDQLTLQGSGRYTKQDRNWEGCARDNGDGTTAAAFNFLGGALSGFTVNPGLVPGGCITLNAANMGAGMLKSSLNQDNVSWRTSINFKPDPDTLLYVGVTKGFKAGAYPSLPLISASQIQPVPQESILAVEGGFKGGFLQHTIEPSGAVFYYDYRDKQLEGYTNVPLFGSLPGLVSIPKSRIWGAELALLVRPMAGLTINANVTYINSKVLADPSNPTGPYVEHYAPGSPVSFVGQSFPFAPDLQAAVDAQYRWAVGAGSAAYIGASLTTRSSTHGSLYSGIASAAPYDHLLDMPGYSVVDMRAGLEFNDSKWRLEVWGRNIFNTFYITNADRANDSTFRFTGMPVIYGVTLKYRF
jgi:iron complex outermembrane receptor protein